MTDVASVSRLLQRELAAVGRAKEIVPLKELPTSMFAPGANVKGIAWLPKSIPNGRSIFIASSRLGNKLDEFPSWFDAVRTFACSLMEDQVILLTADGTTADPFVRRIGNLFGIPVVQIKQFPKRVSKTWIARQQALPETNLIWVEITEDVSIDSILCRISSEVRVLRVSAGGNVFRAVSQRLEERQGQTWVLVDQTLSKPVVSQQLCDAGATAWWLFDFGGDKKDNARKDEQCCAPIITMKDIETLEFVIHWTRRRCGPWPNQNAPDYLDDLIFRTAGAPHDVLSSLRQILITDRIIASARLTRSDTPVVSFSNVPLDQIEHHREFRYHLQRWDFEPYGIAVKRERLQELGGRPAIYGDDGDWDRLSESDQPFFQLATSRDKKYDWRREREWRLCGDLHLKQIGADQVVVFVPSEEEAAAIAPLSRWPIVVVGG